jgi:hypothetical protein
VEGQVVLQVGALVAAEGEDGGRLCTADGSVLELAPGATVALGPTGGASGLEMALQEGNLLFLALEPTYQFVVPGCLVSVSEVPARFSVALNSAATRLRVEEGMASCVMEGETVALDTCSEIIAAPGAEPEIGDYCAVAPQPTATLVTRPPTPVTPAREPTDTPTPTPTPTITPTPTPTPTATRRVIILTSTPTPVPPTITPYVQPTQPPSGNGGGGGNGGNGGNGGDGGNGGNGDKPDKPKPRPTAVKE